MAKTVTEKALIAIVGLAAAATFGSVAIKTLPEGTISKFVPNAFKIEKKTTLERAQGMIKNTQDRSLTL